MPRRSREEKRRGVDRNLQRQIDDLAFREGPRGYVGNQGVPGVDGRTVLSGISNPTAGQGQNGDFYINTNTWSIFGPKTGGSWGFGTSIVGAAGSTGPQGIQGVPGPNTLPVTSISTSPGRALNTTFQVHATRPAIVIYSCQLHTVLTLIGTSSAKCELRSDAGSPPTVRKSEVMHQINIGVGIAVNQQSDVINNLVAFIEAGHNIRMVSTLANGGTVTLTQQLEIVL